jgi:methylisocitrate lyase
MTRARKLRELLSAGCVAMPGAFNAFTGRLIERAGFDAVYVSGAGLANATAGVPDIGLLGLDEVAQLVRYITDAVRCPVVADADTGFGGASNVARTVAVMESAGIAAIHLEDQEFPKRCGHVAGKTVVPMSEMTARLTAAAAAKRDPDFLIIARTDARAVEGFDAAVKRAKAYLDAGAEAIFPEALQSADEFAAFAKAVGGLLLANMTEFGKGPLLPVAQLSQMGYRMVIFPQTAFRAASRTIEQSLADLKKTGTQQSWLGRMQTRDELYNVLGYDPAQETWLGNGPSKGEEKKQ